MPRYSFRCTEGCAFDASYPMADVPAATDCPSCGGTAVRRVTAPFLSNSASAAYRLIDRTARSAHEPEVVKRLPAGGGAPSPRITRNPLHRNLPRP